MLASHLSFWQIEFQRGFHSFSRVQVFVLAEDFLKFVDLFRSEFGSDSARRRVLLSLVSVSDGSAFRRGRFALITGRIAAVFWNWAWNITLKHALFPFTLIEVNRKCIEARILTDWRRAVSWSRDLILLNGLWFLFNFGNLWFWLQIDLVIWCWRSRLNHTRHVRPVRLLLRLQSLQIMKALGEPVHRKLLDHDCCLCVWGRESIRVQSKTVCQTSRSGLYIYLPVPHHINICMEELTPDRFSIIRPNGSLLKSLHILWLCESLAPACLWAPLAHPAVCILFKHRCVRTTGSEWRINGENCSVNNGILKFKAKKLKNNYI